MNAVSRLILPLLCAVLLCSCADSVPDGVLIVPSSQNGGVVSGAVLSETADSAEVDTAALEPVEPSESAAVEDAVSDDAFDALAQARILMEDAQFRALLEEYHRQTPSEESLAIAAAVLAYQKLHGETAMSQTADASDAGVVYWTGGGSVWHVTASCSALAKSKSILSGTEDEAQKAGKTRVCKRCGE